MTEYEARPEKLSDLTSKDLGILRDIAERLMKFKLQQWDLERQAEHIIGDTLNMEEGVDEMCIDCDTEHDITLEHTDYIIEKWLQNPDE